jgi:hypothetical protein
LTNSMLRWVLPSQRKRGGCGVVSGFCVYDFMILWFYVLNFINRGSGLFIKSWDET